MVVGNCEYLYFLARHLKILQRRILRNICLINIRGFAKFKQFQKSPKKCGSGWVGPGLIRTKKIGKSSKNKVLRLYNSPLADSMHIECDSFPQAKKQKVYKTCNVCLKVFPSAHYLTKHKQEAGHKKK